MARMDFFAALGFSFTDMDRLGVNPAMVDLHLQYRAPASYPQTLKVTTRRGELAPRKLELLYEITDDSGGVINTARTFHVWTGPDGRAFNIEENMPDVYARLKSS
jgi:acyl-CoA thioester hydrolase